MADVLPSSLRASSSYTSFFDASHRFRPARKNAAASYSELPLLTQSLSSSSNSTSTSLSIAIPSLMYHGDDDDDDDSADSSDDGLSLPAPASDNRRTRILNNSDNSQDDTESETDAPPSSPILVLSAPSPDHALAPTPDAIPLSEDDSAVRVGPSRHVDYLTHK